MSRIANWARAGWGLVGHTWSDFNKDDCSRLAAALAFYTVFSLPPLLVLLIAIAGTLWDPADVQRAIQGQIGALIGGAGADAVATIIRYADRPDTERPVAAVGGIAALLFGATGAFLMLQGALNRAWRVQPDPAQGGIRNFLLKRLFSLGMVLAIAFLLLVSLALSAALAAAGGAVTRLLPGVSAPLLEGVNAIVSFGVITLLFAAMYKVLPDAVIAWRDVWVGSLATAFLFVLGKFLLGFYFGRNDPGSAYGAAGSLALVLIWIYYASMLVLFGAEFTEAWSTTYGGGIRPEKGAVKIEMRTERVDEEGRTRGGNEGTSLEK